MLHWTTRRHFKKIGALSGKSIIKEINVSIVQTMWYSKVNKNITDTLEQPRVNSGFGSISDLNSYLLKRNES